MEQRRPSQSKSSPLPADYLEMVNEVFTSHFDVGLKALSQFLPNPYFFAHGEVFSNEIVIAISLMSDAQIAATTLYASCDFDPKASAPTVQDLLAACVDAIGSFFGTLISPDVPENLAKLADESLSSLENIPFQWTAMESDGKQIFIKIDKSNPKIDELADDWLFKNDPELKKIENENQKKVESRFFTGPKSKSGSEDDSGMSH
jgi:hypothetical protein